MFSRLSSEESEANREFERMPPSLTSAGEVREVPPPPFAEIVSRAAANQEMQAELERLREESRAAVEQAHRQYRRDLVPLRRLPDVRNR